MRTKRNMVRLIIGIAILVCGIGIEAGAFGVPPHLRVYCSITNSNVVLLETKAEYLVPLSTIEPYTQNLTTGDRTISIVVYYQNELVLNQSCGNVGLGYNLVRTNSITKAIPIGSNLSIVMQLMAPKGILSRTTTSIVANPGLLWPLVGAIIAVSGIVLMSPNGKHARKREEQAKKARDLKPP